MADPGRGRRQLLIIVGAVATMNSLWLAVDLWRGGVDRNIFMALGRIVIFIGLGAFALRGFRWARGCIVIWLGYLTVASLWGGIVSVIYAPPLAVVLFGVTGGVAYGAYVLFTSDDVEALLTAQRPRDSTVSRPSKSKGV